MPKWEHKYHDIVLTVDRLEHKKICANIPFPVYYQYTQYTCFESLKLGKSFSRWFYMIILHHLKLISN